MSLQDSPVGIPHQITPGNLLMLARNEAVPFDTRVEATLRLHQELPFVPDHLRGKYASEISAIRAHLGVGEIPKEASEMGIADEFAKLTGQFEDLAARFEKIEAIVLDLAAAPKIVNGVIRGDIGAPPFLGNGPATPVTERGTHISLSEAGANYQGPATSLTVENGIVTGVKGVPTTGRIEWNVDSNAVTSSETGSVV